MSTRGTYGVRIDGVDKLGYNHHDSYPSYLGANMLEAIRSLVGDIRLLQKNARNLQVVDNNYPPTDVQIEKFGDYSDTQVSNQTVQDWYCLLRELQGDLAETLKAGVIFSHSDFILDSLFCEWGYILNLDDNIFEVYKGFQSEPHLRGRYSKLHPVENKYYPCALVAEFDIYNLPSKEDFLERVGK